MPKNVILSESQFNRLLCEYAGVTDYLYPLAQYMTSLIVKKFYGEHWDVAESVMDFFDWADKGLLKHFRISDVDESLIKQFPAFKDKSIFFYIEKTKRFKGSFDVEYYDGIRIPITLSAYFIIDALEQSKIEKIYLTILHELVHVLNIVTSDGDEANEWMTRGYQNKKTDKTYILQYLFSRTEMNARLNAFILYFRNRLETFNDISNFQKIYDNMWEELANRTGVDIMLEFGDSLEGYEVNELLKVVPEYFGIKNTFMKYDSFESKKQKILSKLKSVATNYKRKIDKAMYLTWKQVVQEKENL